MGGQMIGINTAIYSRTGGSIGIGFAIPSNMVHAVVEAAKGGSEYFERPYIGAAFEEVDAQIAESLGMERPAGALISSVAGDGPAARAGMKPGDVVLAMNGRPIEHVDALGYRLATQPIGAVIKLDVLSQGEDHTVEVTLERAPEGASATQFSIDGRSPFAGSRVAALSPRLAQRLGMRSETTGVAVVDIAPGSPAASFGLMPRDIVREVNGETITSAEQLRQVASQNTRWWRFTIERNGQILRQMLRY
jgi:S1-C subfamily serine protease